MTSKRTEYDASFKLEVARMVVDQGLTVTQVVKDMQVGRTSVDRWVAQYSAEKNGSPGIGKPLTAEQQRPCPNQIAPPLGFLGRHQMI